MTDSRHGESGGPEGSDSEFFIEKSSGFRPVPVMMKGQENPVKNLKRTGGNYFQSLRIIGRNCLIQRADNERMRV
ncbi:hypothetical protein [Paraburkholderia acidipaludis]|uniref:hypothetical protein n=1 Tax=Paraburkholderia acidipaludis TaxID=660537 RepID=UPI0012EB9072|nr:hypothetical protein [Paraburkholderia acidipaludis]